MSSVPETSEVNSLNTCSFSYKPFDHDTAPKTHIRVIQIKEGRGEQIRCVMKSIRRPETRSESSYSCLSYTWQPHDPGCHIYIEGEHINEGTTEVGKNLGDFLRAARDANVTNWLWIDALCINQRDLAEKEQQVRQMSRTFKQAEKVFVWLGLFDEPTMHVLEDILAAASELEVEQIEETLSIDREVLIGQQSMILSAPYWTRVWIAQEILLAEEPILFFGKCHCPLHKFVMFHQLIEDRHDCYDDFSTLPGTKYVFRLYVRHWTNMKVESASLAETIRPFAKSGCQDKRDRVYALLSLADDADTELVNYTISEDVLFRNTMALMKRHKRPLDELLLIGEALTEALELWPATNPSSSILEINFDGTEDMTVPIWGHATLEMGDATEEAPTETIEATCMYVGIRDGPDLHVFEYAVEKAAETPPVVKYSRAHEYLQGGSLARILPVSEDGAKYFWLEGVPSEDVYYFFNPDTDTRRLRSWKAREFRFSGESADKSAECPGRFILPAQRIVEGHRSAESPAWEGHVRVRGPRFFTAAHSDLLSVMREYEDGTQLPPLARDSRSTTIRRKPESKTNSSQETEESSSEEVDEEVFDEGESD